MIFSFLFIYIFVVNIVYYVVHIVCEVDVIANSLVLYLPFCSTLNKKFFSSSSLHPVRTQGCVEPDCSVGSHKSIGKWNGQVSATTCGLQGLHHTARCHVTHVRESLPRDATETTHLVVCRQQCLQWRLL